MNFTAEELKGIREELGLSVQEFADAIGLADARMVRAWEAGTRWGEPYGPSPTAKAAIRYLRAIFKAVQTIDSRCVGAANTALIELRDSLPENLQ